jgi:hypothetical protein
MSPKICDEKNNMLKSLKLIRSKSFHLLEDTTAVQLVDVVILQNLLINVLFVPNNSFKAAIENKIPMEGNSKNNNLEIV